MMKVSFRDLQKMTLSSFSLFFKYTYPENTHWQDFFFNKSYVKLMVYFKNATLASQLHF